MTDTTFRPSQTHMLAKIMWEDGQDLYDIAKNLSVSSQVAKALLQYWGYAV